MSDRNPLAQSVKIGCMATSLVMGMWGLGEVQAATVVFQDSFSNGIVTDSDSQTGYWTTSNGGTPGGTYTETVGSGLTMTVARPTTGNNSQTHLMTPTYGYLNFNSANKITIDCSLATSYTSTNSAGSFLFTLTSQPLTNEFVAEDAIKLLISPYPTYTQVRLSRKTDAPQGSFTTLTERFPTTVSRFVLELNNTDYSLSLYKADSSLAGTYTGAHGIDMTKWGPSGNVNQYNQNSAIDMMVLAQKVGSPADPGNMIGTLKNLTISNVPEPGSLAILSLGGLLLAYRKR